MHRVETIPKHTKQPRDKGFTIVELLIVIVVIAVLAAVVIVAYNGIRERANDSTVKGAISQMLRQLGVYNVDNNRYPGSITDLPKNSALIYQYSYTEETNSFCLSISGRQSEYYVSNDNTTLQAGVCSGHISYISGGGPPPAAPEWSAISTSYGHACGIYAGKAYCWGDNASGQLGDGTNTLSSVPVAVKTATMSGPVTAISVGSYHTCALSGGVAYCWGNNSNGKLGTGNTTASNEPVPVVTSVMSGVVTDIAAGGNHTCAVANNAAFCWGRGVAGQLGNGAGVSSTSPVAVTTSVMSGLVTKIASGYQHSCAIAGGNVYCWGGYAGYGQLGNGTTGTSTAPVAVTTGTMPANTATAIGTGSESYHTCAISSARAYCWGHNGNGKIGDGTTTTPRSTPTAVLTSLMSGDITSVAVGGSHSCATRADGTAFCWGGNVNGQLGDGGTTASSSPKAIQASWITGELLGISAGAGGSCTFSAGHAYCWGRNESGQLGNGTVTTQSPSPVEALIVP